MSNSKFYCKTKILGMKNGGFLVFSQTSNEGKSKEAYRKLCYVLVQIFTHKSTTVDASRSRHALILSANENKLCT